MASINFSLAPAPGVTNDMIAVIYKTTAPAAEIDRLPIPYPHTSPVNLSFPNVVPGTYFVKIHETPGGGVLGNLRHDFWTDASLQKLFAYTVKSFQVGAGRGTPYFDPADQAINYINTDLNGLDYTVFKPGYGPLDWATNITPYTGGGFSFADGQKFSQDEIYTLLVSNLVMQPILQVGGSYPEDIINETVDFTFDTTRYNKLLEIAGSATIFTITMPAFSSIPDGTKFGINTHSGSQRYVTVQLPSGKSVPLNGDFFNTIYVGKGEEVHFIKRGDYLRIINWAGDHRRVGEKVMCGSKPPVNGLQLIGGWYLKVDYPRLFEWFVNVLDPGELGTGADDVTPDAANITKWIIGVNKFWCPKHNGRFYRATDPDSSVDPDGSRPVNWPQADENKAHNHVTAPYDKASAKASDVGGNVTPTGLDSGNATLEYQVGGMNNTTWSAATILSQGTESRPKNVTTDVYVII
jgi:hypothetical protein